MKKDRLKFWNERIPNSIFLNRYRVESDLVEKKSEFVVKLS